MFCVSGFSESSVTALNSAISGSIFADPAACFMMMTALPRISPFALPTHHSSRLSAVNYDAF